MNRNEAIQAAAAQLTASDAQLQSDPESVLAARHRRNALAWLDLAHAMDPVILANGAMIATYSGSGQLEVSFADVLPHPELAAGVNGELAAGEYRATFTPAALGSALADADEADAAEDAGGFHE